MEIYVAFQIKVIYQNYVLSIEKVFINLVSSMTRGKFSVCSLNHNGRLLSAKNGANDFKNRGTVFKQNKENSSFPWQPLRNCIVLA